MTEEKTFSVGVQTSSPKRISVTSNVSENPITASADTGLYYSQLAKNWAIGEGLIQNEDYSSKTWAGESKSSADLSKMYSEAASLDLTNLESKIIEYDEQLNTTITDGVNTIETLQSNSIAEIEANKIGALSSIETNLNNATNEINTNRANTLAQISTLANTSISDINAVGKSYDNLTYRNITNCLLEVPQRIKLELVDGAAILKAGSEVIVPNGADTFDYVTIETDLTCPNGGSGTNSDAMLCYNATSKTLTYGAAASVTSGTIEPTGSGYFYDVTNNEIKYYSNGVAQGYRYAFPVALVTRENGAFTTVKNLFNGIGYIGSTLWVDKGVKGLIPNKRNEDGSLRNIEIVTSKISINTCNDAAKYCGINSEGVPYFTDGTYYYNKKENTNIQNNLFWAVCVVADFDVTNGKITSFTPKQPFRAVDYNDKSQISGWGMPSSKYIDLTLGASGSSYTAPANGWVVISKKTNSTNQSVSLGRPNSVRYNAYCPNNASNIELSLPVQKGQSFYCTYSAGGALNFFRFVYAQGEV